MAAYLGVELGAWAETSDEDCLGPPPSSGTRRWSGTLEVKSSDQVWGMTSVKLSRLFSQSVMCWVKRSEQALRVRM